jgi:Rrf2 family protein
MADLLKMTSGTALGLHAMAHLAARKRNVTGAEIATALGASEAHLAKVLQRLARAGFLRSIRGPKGGFTLARDPGDVCLLEVYETLEGPLRTDGCLFSGPVCERVSCMMGDLVANVRHEVRGYLERTTFADIAEEAR